MLNNFFLRLMLLLYLLTFYKVVFLKTMYSITLNAAIVLKVVFLNNVLDTIVRKIHLSLFAARVLLSPLFLLPHCILRFLL